MQTDPSIETHPSIEKVQGLLSKIDHLRLPASSRRNLESILVRQVSIEIDRCLPWQAGHGRRTAAIALMIGQAAGLTAMDLHHLKLAAYLHDVGLLLLPHDVRTDRQPLEAEAYVAVQNHPRRGAAVLEPFSFLQEASVLIAHHHERWDGSGYPYGIRGTFIPLGARILAIADAFDAIRVPGIQDHSLRNVIALRILQVASGSQFDPLLVRALANVLRGDASLSLVRQPYQ